MLSVAVEGWNLLVHIIQDLVPQSTKMYTSKAEPAAHDLTVPYVIPLV